MANREKVLLIDDDPLMHDAVRMILEPVGYEVICRTTGPEGLETARIVKPDLILLDVMLSTPSEGFHLAYELKNDEQLTGVPIIMVSAIGSTMGMDYARELGSDYLPVEQFIDKPFDALKLRKAVDAALHHEPSGA